MKVLIVDDSQALRRLLKRIVQGLGFEVVEAGNGRQALDAVVSDGPFTLALVDWNMPVMNGLELVQAIRREPRYDEMRIVMVTTETDEMPRALAAGATAYLIKPFTAESVREKLGSLGLLGPA